MRLGCKWWRWVVVDELDGCEVARVMKCLSRGEKRKGELCSPRLGILVKSIVRA